MANAAVGGLIFGYDISAFSGAILFVKRVFPMGEPVVSAFLIGAVIGAAAGGALTDRFGRGWLIS